MRSARAKYPILLEQVRVSRHGEKEHQPRRDDGEPILYRCFFIQGGGREVGEAQEGEDERDEGCCIAGLVEGGCMGLEYFMVSVGCGVWCVR